MTTTTILHGSSPTQSEAMVTADQETIFGNGTRADPLRAATGDASLLFTIEARWDSGIEPQLGMAVAVDAPPGTEEVVVSPGSASREGPAIVQGLVDAILATTPVVRLRVRFGGPMTLSAGAWDAIAGTTGGLTPGAPYFLSVSPGRITATAPSASEQFVSRVGVASSSLTLMLGTPSDPLQNP